jgi:hypothetical protein
MPLPNLLLNAAFIAHCCFSYRVMLPAASFYGKELLWLRAGQQCEIVTFASGDALASVCITLAGESKR